MSKEINLSNIAKLELESIERFQYGLHYSTRYIKHIDGVDVSDDDSYPPSDDPETVFRTPFRKTSWSVLEKEKVSSKSSKSGTIEFIFNDKMDFAIRCYLTKKFPKIMVKKELKGKIEICWSSNLGHHCYKTIKLYIGGSCVQTTYPLWQDIYYKYEMHETKKDIYIKMINGNFPEVWSDHVKGICLKTPLSFSFEKHISQAIPLFALPESIKASIVVEYRTELQDFIKMRIINEDGKIEEVPFDSRCVEFGEMREAPPPEMCSDYSKITDEERNFYETVIFKNGTEPSSVTYYYEDIIKLPVATGKPGGPLVDIDLSSKLPVKGIYWVAQSKDAIKYHNYSNYTTNPLDKTKGQNPISKVSLTYNGGTDYKIADMESYHFDEISSFYRGNSGSLDLGYGYIPLCYKSDDFRSAQIGLTFSKNNPKIHFTLDDGKDSSLIEDQKDISSDALLKSIKSGEGRKQDTTSTEYEIHVFLLVTKRIDFFYKKGVVVYDGFNEIKYYDSPDQSK